MNQNDKNLTQRIRGLFETPTNRFDQLVKAAGLNPQTDLRYGNWRNLDFSNADLRGFDFSGADLTGVNFRDALISGAVFTGAAFDSAALREARDVAPKGVAGDPQSRQQRSGYPRGNRQTTLRSQATVTGVGVHSGLPVNLTLGPAPVDAGFVFVRTGLGRAVREVLATADQVVATQFATVLGDAEGPVVSTAEHVLAALRGMGIDNASIEIDGPEVPIMDGSAAAFVAAIDQAGIVAQPAVRRFIQIIKPVQVALGERFGEIRPYAAGFRAEVEIDFANPAIGRQKYALEVSPERFRREISRARNFGCMNDVARLWGAGFALGASFENTVVFDDERLLNAEGLRYVDECARHKVLDVIGDLALAGLPLLGAFRSVRGGHTLNHAVLTALLADRTAWRVVEKLSDRSTVRASKEQGVLGRLLAPRPI